MRKLPFDVRQCKQAVVFIGIQASGKTTFYREWLAPHGYVHVNLDTLRTRSRESEVMRDCYARGASFVVDNTNPGKADRERYIPTAKAHGGRSRLQPRISSL